MQLMNIRLHCKVQKEMLNNYKHESKMKVKD